MELKEAQSLIGKKVKYFQTELGKVKEIRKLEETKKENEIILAYLDDSTVINVDLIKPC